jgi:hypothetical protein
MAPGIVRVLQVLLFAVESMVFEGFVGFVFMMLAPDGPQQTGARLPPTQDIGIYS